MTCRYCKKETWEDEEGMVKYGTRHYAHYACFLDLKGTHGLLTLPAWKLRLFPWRIIKERKIEKQMKEALAAAERKDGPLWQNQR